MSTCITVIYLTVSNFEILEFNNLWKDMIMNEGENSRKRIKFPNVSFFGYTAPFLEVFTTMFCGLGCWLFDEWITSYIHSGKVINSVCNYTQQPALSNSTVKDIDVWWFVTLSTALFCLKCRMTYQYIKKIYGFPAGKPCYRPSNTKEVSYIQWIKLSGWP